MSDQLSPKELARIKRLARNRRITTIRKRVAVLGISLAAIFSGAILVRSQIGQPAAGQSTPTSGLAMVTGGDDGSGSGVANDHESDDHESDDEGSGSSDIGSVIAGAVGGLVGGGQDGSSSTGATAQSAPVQKAPLVTSQS